MLSAQFDPCLSRHQLTRMLLLLLGLPMRLVRRVVHGCGRVQDITCGLAQLERFPTALLLHIKKTEIELSAMQVGVKRIFAEKRLIILSLSIRPDALSGWLPR